MKFTLDDGAFQSMLKDMADQDLRKAVTYALNDTAADVLKHQQARMDVVFDRPTKFTKNAFMVWRASINNLEAQVLERLSVGERHYLKVQESGGVRPLRGFEGRIALAAPDPIYGVMPGEHAKLDAYGNWSNGERNQVQSQLKVQRDVGVTSNETATSKARGSRKKRARYFIPKHGLAPGVYRRETPDGLAFRILKFASSVPNYTARLGFYDGAEDVYRVKLPEHLSRTIAKMVAKRSGGGST